MARSEAAKEKQAQQAEPASNRQNMMGAVLHGGDYTRLSGEEKSFWAVFVSFRQARQGLQLGHLRQGRPPANHLPPFRQWHNA